MQASPIRKLYGLANDAKKKGVKIYHLNIGQPDIPTPKAFLKAVNEYAEKIVAYAPSQGQENCQKAYVKYYQQKGINLTAENIIVTTGGSEALIFAFAAVTDPKDEIIVFEPFYTNYNGFATIVGAKLAPIRTTLENNFRLPDLETIEQKISSKTKAILICNPNNPTGTVYSKKELDILAQIAIKHNLFLIGDEVYSDFVFKGKHQSLLAYKKLHDRVIVIDSVSKKYSSCGVRIGAFISRNPDLITAALKFGQARLSVATIEQAAAAKIIGRERRYLAKTVVEYRTRRDVVYESLRKIPNVTVGKPEGAFYNIIGLPIKSSEHFAAWLLTDFSDRNETVMVAPAEGFYATKGLGRNEVRLAYVLQAADMKRAIELLAKGLELYRKLF